MESFSKVTLRPHAVPALQTIHLRSVPAVRKEKGRRKQRHDFPLTDTSQTLGAWSLLSSPWPQLNPLAACGRLKMVAFITVEKGEKGNWAQYCSLYNLPPLDVSGPKSLADGSSTTILSQSGTPLAPFLPSNKSPSLSGHFRSAPAPPRLAQPTATSLLRGKGPGASTQTRGKAEH